MRHHLQMAGKGRSVKVSSAGTMASQPGARPDKRVQTVAAAAGIDLGRIRASRVTAKELARSDFVFAMDGANYLELLKICPAEHSHKISLLLSHLPEGGGADVPDPYYGNYEGFREVFQLIQQAVVCLVPNIGSAN